MDASIVERHNELLNSIEVDSRLNGSKLGSNTVVVSTDSDTQELINSQYMNIHRLPENLQKVQLVGDALSNELLNHQVVELTQGNEFVPGTVGNQYYDDDLLPHDLTEEDKRLAAALVAVQLVQQQKQQHSLLTSELLSAKSMSPLSPLSMDKPGGMAAMVTGYIQAFDDDPTQQQLIDTQNHDRILKLYQTQTAPHLPELRLPPLPPLKKVLSSQTMIRNRFNDRILTDTAVSDPHRITLPSPQPPVTLEQEVQVKTSYVSINKMTKHDVGMIGGEDPQTHGEVEVGGLELEEGDSDLDPEGDLKSASKSLPHKKRIPRKLKTQPTSRSPHSKGLKCSKCGETFASQSVLWAHNRSVHGGGGAASSSKRPAYSCEICSTICQNQAKFFEHLKTHYEPQRNAEAPGVPSVLTEPVEGVMSSSNSKPVGVTVEEVDVPSGEAGGDGGVGVGVGVVVVGGSSFPCTLCGRLFKRQKALETHLNSAHPAPTQIEEFSEPEDMMEGIRHVVNIQAVAGDTDPPRTDNKSWKYCDEFTSDVVCSSGHDLEDNKTDNEHKTEVDDGMGDFPEDDKGKKKKKLVHCPHCTRTFTHRNSLLYHVRSYSGRRLHQCDVCGKGFFAANALRVHMRMHSGDKPYKCEVCGRNFRQWGDLKYHVISLHSNTRQYQCEFCGKDFARKYSLIVHRRIHTGEKNYVCEFCRKTFRASSYLNNHRRIHTGEKPYTCDLCHKPFRVKSDMKRHRNIHNKVVNNSSTGGGSVRTNEGDGSGGGSGGGEAPKPVVVDTGTAGSASLQLTSRAEDEFRAPPTSDPSTLYVWLPVTTEETIPESILPD